MAARHRLRAALAAAALLTAGIPVVASATAPALKCTSPAKGYWQTLEVDAFRPIEGMSSTDSITSYAVDEGRPQNVAVTNGKRVQLSADHGCNWSDSLTLSPLPSGTQSFAGGGARIVSMALWNGLRVAAVQEGSGAASRPHIMRQAGGGGWETSDDGLPVNGVPTLLRIANDGHTLYLTVSPTGGGSSGGTTGLPGLPGVGGGGVAAQTGLLYASTDGGASWALRTTASDLPTGGTGFSQLDIDPDSANRLFGIVNGRLAISSNGGASFQTSPETDYTAITAMGPGTFIAFRSAGRAVYSASGGSQLLAYNAPAGVSAVAFRSGDSGVLLEINGQFGRYEVGRAGTVSVPAPRAGRDGTLLGDRGVQSSFHALTGHSLLRYVDAVPPGEPIPPIAVGDTSVPPPLPGKVLPAVANVTLPVGESTTQAFTLNLPKNPTPLDLVFLVDVSGSQIDYINSLKGNIKRIVAALTRNKLDLKVGVSTLGAGPAAGDNEYPDTYVYPPQANTTDPLHPPKQQKYVRPVLYKRIRAVGDTGPALQKAIDALTIESDNLPNGVGPSVSREGALLALEQVVTGSGIHTKREDDLGLDNVWRNVPPNQQANFRADSSVRRVVILSTDEAFDYPYPQKHVGDRLDFSKAVNALRSRKVQVIGLSGGDVDSLPDLRRVARETSTFAPPGGVTCDNGSETGIVERVAEGEPLVCNTADKFADAIIRLLSSLVDRQNVSLVALNKSPVLGALQGRALLGLDVKRPNSAQFTVNVSCVGVKPGRYATDVATVLRGTRVGQAHLNVTCLKAQAAVPPKPLPDVPQVPPAAPQPGPAIPPPAPPAPAVQPQVQVQTQVQVNPMSAAAIQEQQELQLALALNGTLKDDDPVFNPGAQMAMVDRRKREQVQAMYVLALAMTACAGLGLARLRARPDVQVRRAG